MLGLFNRALKRKVRHLSQILGELRVEVDTLWEHVGHHEVDVERHEEALDLLSCRITDLEPCNHPFQMGGEEDDESPTLTYRCAVNLVQIRNNIETSGWKCPNEGCPHAHLWKKEP